MFSMLQYVFKSRFIFTEIEKKKSSYNVILLLLLFNLKRIKKFDYQMT